MTAQLNDSGDTMNAAQTQTPEAPDRRGLAGKVAIVTGARRGIGAAAARTFAGAGAAVALAARDRQALEEVAGEIEASGGRAVVVATDVTDAGAVETLVAQTVDAVGRLDVALNNAGGGFTGNAPLAEQSVEDLDRMLALNLGGPEFMTVDLSGPSLTIQQRHNPRPLRPGGTRPTHGEQA